MSAVCFWRLFVPNPMLYPRIITGTLLGGELRIEARRKGIPRASTRRRRTSKDRPAHSGGHVPVYQHNPYMLADASCGMVESQRRAAKRWTKKFFSANMIFSMS